MAVYTDSGRVHRSGQARSACQAGRDYGCPTAHQLLGQFAGRLVVGVDLGEGQASQSGVRGGGNGIEDI